jgi:hypothetical protein
MTIEEILKSLEGYEKKDEVKGLIEKLIENTGKESSKKANGEAKNLRERLKKLLGALDLDETDDDLDEKIEELKTLKKPETKDKLSDYEKLSKEVGVMKREREAEKADKAKLTEKVHSGLKKSSLIKALTEKNAIDPELIAEVLSGKLKVKEDDSVVFLDGENEVDVAKGVEGFLETKKHLIKNSQSPGAGSSSGGQDGTQTPSVEQLKAMNVEDYIKNRPKA